jgi:8-oxo-dGTP diphosphatase
MKKRRRGTAIVETSKGILVTSGRKKIFLLPGGGAEHNESRRKAAIRELREETGLKAYSSHFLFKFEGAKHKNYKGGHFKDYHKVFLIKASGVAKPRHEIKHIEWYKPSSEIHLSRITKTIIEQYYLSNQKNDKSSESEKTNNSFFEEDCYKVLGLKPTATNNEISKRFKQLSTMYHPDRALNEEVKELHNLKMSELNDAYQKIKKIRGL